jgi:hypothetical protein
MTIILYHSTLISDRASEQEAVTKTSSHIFLSGGVAGAVPDILTLPPSDSPTLITSLYESDSTHIMTVGNAASQSTASRPNKMELVNNPTEESELF